jgi:hypothetical protein
MRDQNRFGYLNNDTYDRQWQEAFRDYLISKCILDTVYWSVNPESGDTGGLFTSPYRAGSNESGWGTWGALDSRKMALVNSLWNATGCGGTSATPTRTNTPGTVFTPTRTNTPNSFTPTRTNTPNSFTPTRTNTPNSFTPTRTNTPSSFTPTRTNTPSVVTATPTTGTGPCTPTSTITIPFSFDGAGTFCWQAANLGGFINSWNTNSVTLNGVNVTNVWVGSGSYPAKIGGFYYVAYNGSFAWSHFESK